jgi:hypothetical protein
LIQQSGGSVSFTNSIKGTQISVVENIGGNQAPSSSTFTISQCGSGGNCSVIDTYTGNTSTTRTPTFTCSPCDKFVVTAFWNGGTGVAATANITISAGQLPPPSTPFQYSASFGPPTGTCSSSQQVQDITNPGHLYICPNGSWVLSGGGGGSGTVFGPTGSTANDLAGFADSTGQNLYDPGIQASNVAQLPGPSAFTNPISSTAAVYGGYGSGVIDGPGVDCRQDGCSHSYPATSTGTVAGQAAVLNVSGTAGVQSAAGTELDGVIGIALDTAASPNLARIVYAGPTNCIFGSGTTKGHWVQIATGGCVDSGVAAPGSKPSSGTEVVGIVTSTNASAGTYEIIVTIPQPAIPQSTSSPCTVTCWFVVGTDSGSFQNPSIGFTVPNLHVHFARFWNSTPRKLGTTCIAGVQTADSGGHMHMGVYSIAGSTLTLQYDCGAMSTTGSAPFQVVASSVTAYTMSSGQNYYIAYCADNSTSIPYTLLNVPVIYGGGGLPSNAFGIDSADSCTASAAALPSTVTVTNITNTSSNVNVPFMLSVN